MASPFQDSSIVSLLKSMHVDTDENSIAKQIFQIRDDLCFTWNHKDSVVVAIHLDRPGVKVQQKVSSQPIITKLVPTDTPLFNVERLTVSPTGRWICLWGSRGATVLAVPSRSGKQARFIGSSDQDGSVTCHSIPIAERFFLSNAKVAIQQADWHPGSADDSHLMILTSDNTIKIYNVDVLGHSISSPGGSSLEAEQTLPLSKRGDMGITNRSGVFSESVVRSSLGETAVGFAFAPQVQDETSPNLWPVFILRGDGSVCCILTGLGKNKPLKHRVLGPLPMLPEKEDNYGLDSCAILCLHPMISCPPVLVISTSNGTLYHCVVLHRSEEEDSGDVDDDRIETASQYSDWSASVFDEDTRGDLTLYVYESIELELSLTSKTSSKTDASRFPIMLHADPTSPGRYFCSHKAGVHKVTVPMVADLSELASKPDETIMKDGAPVSEQSSVVEHLVCTKLLTRSTPAPILGLAIAFPPPRLMCLMNDYSLIAISLTGTRVGEPQPLLSAQTSVGGSPLKKYNQMSSTASKEPFDRHIAQILKRNTSHPLMRAPPTEDLGPQECYEILSRSLKVMRDEYLTKYEKARKEIEKKTAALDARKAQQHMSLSRLMSEKFELRDKAAQLSERYEDLKDSGDNITSRLEAVLSAIQRRLPVNSDAEVRMQRQLQEIDRKMKDLSNGKENSNQSVCT